MRTGRNKRIFAFITNRCANACRYCFVYDGRQTEDMTLEQFQDLCCQGQGAFEYLTFIGGEPLLHPKLPELMRMALGYGYKISISTSGITARDAKTEEIFSLPIDDVTISLDSHCQQTNDFLRGKGAWRRAIDTATYLKTKGIPFRFTATVCAYNQNDIFRLADLVRDLGAEQLDIHVMSQKGRAAGKFEMSLSPAQWLQIRYQLDQKRYPAPFHISYPLMWYQGDELDEYRTYCDAQTGARLSVMSNCDCYYCTISIGFADYMVPLRDLPIERCPKLYSKTENLCDTEKRIETNDDGYGYVCRFVKRKTQFL